MKRLQNRTAAAAFSTWHSWAETHAEHGAKLHACLVKLQNHTLAAAFSAWADRAARKRERQAGLQAALPKLMHRWQGCAAIDCCRLDCAPGHAMDDAQDTSLSRLQCVHQKQQVAPSCRGALSCQEMSR